MAVLQKVRRKSGLSFTSPCSGATIGLAAGIVSDSKTNIPIPPVTPQTGRRGRNKGGIPRLAQKNVQPGPIVLGIRPEHIMLAGEGEQMIHGTVDVSEMMGSAVHLHLQACGRDTIIIVQTMSMQGATNSSFGIGQSIAFTFGGNVVHVFDPETGKNLEF